MKALTVRQPGASLIAHGVKTIETRSRATKHRGPLAIHAGMYRPVEGAEKGGWWWQWDVDHGIIVNQNAHPRREESPAPLGAIVAVADLVDCIPIIGPDDSVQPAGGPRVVSDGQQLTCWDAPDYWSGEQDERDLSDQLPYGDFTPGRWAWILQDVRPLPAPIPCRGAQGLWTVPVDVDAAVREAVAA